MFPPYIYVTADAIRVPEDEVDEMEKAYRAGLDEREIRALVTLLLRKREQAAAELRAELQELEREVAPA